MTNLIAGIIIGTIGTGLLALILVGMLWPVRYEGVHEATKRPQVRYTVHDPYKPVLSPVGAIGRAAVPPVRHPGGVTYRTPTYVRIAA